MKPWTISNERKSQEGRYKLEEESWGSAAKGKKGGENRAIKGKKKVPGSKEEG